MDMLSRCVGRPVVIAQLFSSIALPTAVVAAKDAEQPLWPKADPRGENYKGKSS